MTQKLDKYQILNKLGAGATAEVYHAVDTSLERDVALKILKPGFVGDEVAFARFQQEAKTLANLVHPHIAWVWDIGQAQGRYFIAMRYVEGPSLEKYIEERGPLPWEKSTQIIEDIAEGLFFAHQKGLVHRDVKPGNIIVSQEEGAVLTDFGIARALHASGLTTHTGAVMGTPAYVAPEIWNGERPSPTVDQYALACVLHETVTGKVLFEGTTPQAVITNHLVKEPALPERWPAGTPSGLEATLLRALSKEPSERYEDVRAFSLALSSTVSSQPSADSRQHSAISDQPVATSPPLKAERPNKPKSVPEFTIQGNLQPKPETLPE